MRSLLNALVTKQFIFQAAAFQPAQMRAAIKWIFRADRGLRDIRPDDRTVMEQFILRLTS